MGWNRRQNMRPNFVWTRSGNFTQLGNRFEMVRRLPGSNYRYVFATCINCDFIRRFDDAGTSRGDGFRI